MARVERVIDKDQYWDYWGPIITSKAQLQKFAQKFQNREDPEDFCGGASERILKLLQSLIAVCTTHFNMN